MNDYLNLRLWRLEYTCKATPYANNRTLHVAASSIKSAIAIAETEIRRLEEERTARHGKEISPDFAFTIWAVKHMGPVELVEGRDG